MSFQTSNSAFGAIYFIFSVLAVTINSLLITSFIVTQQSMKNESNFLIALLSIVDCLNGLTVMPLIGIAKILPSTASNKSLNFAILILFQSFSSISTNLTIIIGIDRYLHMDPDLNGHSTSKRFFRKPRLYILVFSIFIFSITLSIAGAVINEETKLIRAFLFPVYFVSILIVMSTLIIIYIRGYQRIRRFVAENPVYLNRGPAEQPGYMRELYKTVLLLLIAMLVSFLPVCILNAMIIVFMYTNPNIIKSDGFVCFTTISALLLHSNSFSNPLIILYRNKKSKNWLLHKVVGFCCYKQNNVEV